MLIASKREALERTINEKLGGDIAGALMLEGALEMPGKFGLDGLLCFTDQHVVFAADDIIEGTVLHQWPRSEVQGLILADDVLGPMLSFSSSQKEIKLTRIEGVGPADVRARLTALGYLAGESAPTPKEPAPPPQHAIPDGGVVEATARREREEKAATSAAPAPAVSGGQAASGRQYPSAFTGAKAGGAASGRVLPRAPGVSSGGSGGQTSTMAVLSLVLGIVSLFSCCMFASIPAWILGVKAEKEIDGSEGRISGRGMATAGKWIGIIATSLTIIFWIIYIVGIVVGGIR